MGKRLWRFFKKIPEENGVMTNKDAFNHVKGILEGEVFDDRIGIRFGENWTENPFKFIPLLFKIQQHFWEEKVKILKLFQCSKHEHVT